MKKTLLLAAVGLLAASSMDAAKIYLEKPATWENVGIWQFGLTPNTADSWGTTTEVTIDDHLLCEAETNYPTVIFANKGTWNNGQTGNLDVIDGIVYDEDSQHIADIVDGAYVAKGEVVPIDKTALYLRGDMNNWGYDDANKLTKSEDDENVYTITTSIAKGVKFKIGNYNWSNGLDFGGGFSLMMGQEYTLVQGSLEDLVAGENLSNVTLTFNLDTKVLQVSEAGGEVEFNWFAAWNIGQGWVFGNKMEAQTEGTYKIALEIPENPAETNYFAIFNGVTNRDWNDGARYAPPVDKNVAVTTDQTYQMVAGSENPQTWTIGNGNWTVVVDPENLTISFELGDSTGEANVLIDRATEPEWTGVFESYALEEVEGDANCYKWTGSLVKGDKLKFNIHGVNYFYDPSKGNIVTEDFDADDNLSIEYALEEGDEGFVAFDYASNVVITVDVDETKVTVDLADAPRVSMTITKGGESEIHKITQTAQGSKIYVMEHAVTLAPEDQIDFRVLAKRYTVDFSAPQAAAEIDATGTTYAMTENTDDNPAPKCDLTGSYIFKVDNRGTAPVLIVTPSTETGVAEIAADNAEAVYFNLQGVQIEKPENGLFIEVRGNKATKVMVK